MATSLTCDNCGATIDTSGVRWRLNVLWPDSLTGVLQEKPGLDLCSKRCVNEADKDPVFPEGTPVEPTMP